MKDEEMALEYAKDNCERWERDCLSVDDIAKENFLAGLKNRKMMLGGADCYILKDSDGQPSGVLFVELGFNIMKLKDFSITEAIIYLENNEIPFMFRGGVKGTLCFKRQEDIEREKLDKEIEK